MRRAAAGMTGLGIAAGILGLGRQRAIGDDDGRAFIAVTEVRIERILPRLRIGAGEPLAEFGADTLAFAVFVGHMRHRLAGAIALEILHCLVALANADG